MIVTKGKITTFFVMFVLRCAQGLINSTMRLRPRGNRFSTCGKVTFSDLDSINSTRFFCTTEARKGAPILRPLVVCGPSGVGKGTIIDHFMKNSAFSQHFAFTTSHTTRKPRPGEVDGVHYNFISHNEMRRDITEGQFLEYAEVHGNLYGTSFGALRHVEETLGKICMLDIDVQGVKNIKEHQLSKRNPLVSGNFVFIAPPSMKVLKERLKGRGTETSESLSIRTMNAQKEMEYGVEEGNFDVVVVNDGIDQAYQDFETAVKTLYKDVIM